MYWLLLIFAGLLEIGWAIGLKYSEGFTKLTPSIITILLMSLSFFCLSKVLHYLPVGTAYAIWTGIGAVGTAILGIILFGESASITRLSCIALIVLGIVGLKFFSQS